MRKTLAGIKLSLENLAAEGNLRFTARQLYYEVCRAIRQPKGFAPKTAVAVFAASSLPALGIMGHKPRLAAGWLAANAFLSGGLYALRRAPHTLRAPLAFEVFENDLVVYLQNQRRPFGLLDAKTDNGDFPDSYPRDLPLYGLPRLLVCESAEIAQMLRANNFHLEASCAVLSLRQAAPLGNVFREMMERAGESRVFFLHDASLSAFALLPDLRELLNVPESARLQILGLRPAHAERLHLFVQQERPGQIKTLADRQCLPDDETSWLAMGKQAEVAAVNPGRLLRVLRRLILGLPPAPNPWKLALPPRELGFM